ncbi:MAG: hypothetical protein JOZ69_22490, partial [Myxococcales bacterium]|nr:hypothetical protein [Myxococcales bacterium]
TLCPRSSPSLSTTPAPTPHETPTPRDAGVDVAPRVDAEHAPDATPDAGSPPELADAGPVVLDAGTADAAPAIDPACTRDPGRTVTYCPNEAPGGEYACSGAGSIEPFPGWWQTYLPTSPLPPGADKRWCCRGMSGAGT